MKTIDDTVANELARHADAAASFASDSVARGIGQPVRQLGRVHRFSDKGQVISDSRVHSRLVGPRASDTVADDSSQYPTIGISRIPIDRGSLKWLRTDQVGLLDKEKTKLTGKREVLRSRPGKRPVYLRHSQRTRLSSDLLTWAGKV